MNKYDVKTRVKVINGQLEGQSGEIVEVIHRYRESPIYSIKFDRNGITSEHAEEDIEAENLLDEPVDESVYFNNSARHITIGNPKFKTGDVVSLRNAPENILYVVKQIIMTEHTWKRPLSYQYRYEISVLDEGMLEGSSFPAKYMCEEYYMIFQYHDVQWEKYFTESVKNGLPAWRGRIYNLYELYMTFHRRDDGFTNEADDYYNDTIPPKCMEHILDRHTIYGRINHVLKSDDNKNAVMNALHINDYKLRLMVVSLRTKIENRNGIDYSPYRSIKFTSEEINLAQQIDLLDTEMRNGKLVNVDHFKLELLNTDIMRMIQQAYKTATKISAREVHKSTKDRRTEIVSPQYLGKVEYEGVARDGTIIRFTYDFDANVIDTAYPLRMNNNSKKH